jgi:PAS domain S-box-containing protein
VESLDRLARLAARLLGTSAAAVTLVETDRQHFPGAFSLAGRVGGERQTSIRHSICRHVVERGAPLLVPDARCHPLLEDLAVLDEPVVAYLGVPVRSRAGHVLGALCVFDREPRDWGEEEVGLLEDLSDSVAAEFDLRLDRRLRQESVDARDASERHYQRLVETTPNSVYVLDAEGRFTELNAAGARLIGRSAGEVMGKGFEPLIHPEDLDRVVGIFRGVVAQASNDVAFEARLLRPDGSCRLAGVTITAIVEDGFVVGVHGVARDITAERAAQEATRQSEARFRSLVESMEDIVFTLGRDGRHTGLFGRWVDQETAAAYLGRTSREILGPEAASVHEAALARALAGEYVLYEWQSESRHFQTSLSPVHGASGAITGAVGIGRDVTDLKRAETALRLSDERYRLVARASNDVIWDWDVESGALTWVEELESVFGHGPDSLSGDLEFWTRHIHPDDRDRVVGSVHDVIAAGGCTWISEYRFQRGDGTFAHVLDRGHVARDADGRAVHMIGSMLDLTPQREAAERLRRSEERFRLLVDSVRDHAIYTLDGGGRITSWNDGAAAITGYVEEEVIGRCDGFFFGAAGPGAACLLAQAREAGQAEERGWRLRRDGRRLWVQSTLNAIHDDAGELLGYVRIVRDLTEQRRLEEERAELHRRVESERARLVEVFEKSPSFLAVLRGPDHVFELANAAYYALVGERDLRGRPFREALPEIVDQGFVEILDRVRRTGEPHVGTEVPVLLRVEPAEPPRLRYVSFVFQPFHQPGSTTDEILVHGVDVTEAVEARHRVEESAADARLHLSRLEAVLQALPVGVFVTDAGGVVRMTNEAAKRIWAGDTPLVGIEEYGAYPARHAATGAPVGPEEWPIARAIRTGASVLDEELEIDAYDGTPKRVLASGVVFRDESGCVAGGVAINVDLTEQRLTEEKLRQSQKMGGRQARRRDRARLQQHADRHSRLRLAAAGRSGAGERGGRPPGRDPEGDRPLGSAYAAAARL